MDVLSQLQEHNPDDFLEKHPEVKLVRLQWVDYSGIFHCRIVTVSKVLSMSKSGRAYKVPVNCISIPLSTWPSCDVSPPQVWELHPDWSATNAFAMCPRACLMKTLQETRSTHGISFRVGFEIEFVLLNEQLQIPQSIDPIQGYATCAGIRGSNLDLVEEILEALELSDIPTHHLHTEDKDQLEIALDPEEPLVAIDSVMHAQEIIRTMAVRRGLKATMLPKPFLGRHLSNGLHMHFSISEADSAHEHFLAGVLAKLQVLCAFGLPSYDSYQRVNNNGTGEWVGWGTENRELPLRGIDPRHWEYRAIDTTANLYLLMTALLKTGATGMKERLPVLPNCTKFPSELNPQELAEYGLVKTMPKSLHESIRLLKDDAQLREDIGKDLIDKYVKVKDKDLELFSQMQEERRRETFLGFF